MTWQTVVVLAVLIGIVAAILFSAIRNKKKGKSSCSCGGSCGGCAMSGICHPSTPVERSDKGAK